MKKFNNKNLILFCFVILMPISCGKIAKESTEEVVKVVTKKEGNVIAGKTLSKLTTTTENRLLTAAIKSESKLIASKNVNNLLKVSENRLLTATKNVSTKVQEVNNATKITYKRFFVKDKNQFITYNKFEKWLSDSDNNKKLILGKPKDGGVLRENLRMVMGSDYDKFAKTNQFDAHHLVATDSRSQSSIISQKILKRFQIDINDPMNGIILPKNGQSVYFGTIHNGGHKKAYHDLVAQRLRTAKNRKQCLEILDQIKMDLYKGKIELYNVHKVNNLTSAYK